ncbi:MAG: ABC transporter substrate-binding protein [Campylobacterota bacterium]
MKKVLILLLFCLHLFANERIIALSPAINEIVFALGAGGKVVGNTMHSTYPKKAQTLPKVGGYFSPSLEKILALNPDLVIMQQSSIETAHKLQKLQIATEVVKIDTIASIKDTITRIGSAVGAQKDANKLITQIDSALGSLDKITTDKKILFVIGHNVDLTKEIYVAGQNLYFDDIITASGNQNALQSKRSGQPVLNLEKVIGLDPDIIVLLAPYREKNGLSVAQLKSPWLQLPIQAAKKGNIFVQDSQYAGIASDRVVEFIKDFRGFLLEAKSR